MHSARGQRSDLGVDGEVIDTADHPWIDVPGESHLIRQCRLHPEVGSFGPSSAFVVKNPKCTLYGQCPRCFEQIMANPKAADIGLEERPSWWRETTAMTHLGPVALECEEHRTAFLLDEACRRCVDEDDEDVDQSGQSTNDHDKPVNQTPVRS